MGKFCKYFPISRKR